MENKRRLLIVEDDKGIREMLADFLAHYDLAFAGCQKEAYERLNKDRFDLVLLDLRLPQWDGDMSPSREVGIDILKTIREKGLSSRKPETELPVVIMTAHGSERLAPELLVTYRANDYLCKPFDSRRDLESKVERALNNGAMISTATADNNPIRLAIDEERKVVRIETVFYEGACFELLVVLRDLWVADVNALLAPENHQRIPGNQLGEKLGISPENVRKRFSKFREKVAHGLRSELDRTIGKQDIIDNDRRWGGYRLNPRMVRVVKWDEMPDV